MFGTNCFSSLKKLKLFFSYSRIKKILSQRSCVCEALGSECCIQNTASPRLRAQLTVGLCLLCLQMLSGGTSHQKQAHFRSEENIFSFFMQLSHFQKPSILQPPSGEMKMSYKTLPPGVFWKEQNCCVLVSPLREKRRGFPILC